MAILSLQFERLPLKLAGSFRTAKARRTDKETLWVKLTHDGYVGWGESAPVDTYGQTLESSEAALARAGEMLGDDPTRGEAIIDRLRDAMPDQLASVAAIDAALFDWLGKRCGMPVVKLLGLSPEKTPLTSYSLGIDEPDATASRVERAADYPILKVKLGSRHDLETLRLIRRIAPTKTIRVDANAAWTLEEARERLPQMAKFGVEFVEQPLPADDLEGLRRLKEMRVCPIVADESCVTREDVLRVAPCVDGINIKASKCGGIREALKMIHVARAAGLRVMLGCMIESSLGIAAAAQLAPLADWLDLDGHLLLANDPFRGMGGQRGRLTIGAGAGLGVMPVEEGPGGPHGTTRNNAASQRDGP